MPMRAIAPNRPGGTPRNSPPGVQMSATSLKSRSTALQPLLHILSHAVEQERRRPGAQRTRLPRAQGRAVDQPGDRTASVMPRF